MAANETFISSLDMVLSDDDSLANGSANGAGRKFIGIAADEGHAGTGIAGAGIKGRNTAVTITRPGARASKTNALAAINANSTEDGDGHATGNGSSILTGHFPASHMSSGATAKTMSNGTSGTAASLNNPSRDGAAQRSPPLDFSTIRTHTPRHPNPPPRSKPRLFELENAPVYHPSVEEFANPMEYIDKIAPEAREYGICKIVPPEGWRPPFALDTETFRFKTRLQQLNSMEASARASLNFLEQLSLFHRQQGSRGISVPTLGGKPIDMWRLKREVTALGGFITVCNDRRWSQVGRVMGYNITTNPFICSQLKTTYYKIIVPFEDYVARVKLAGGETPRDPRILNDDVPILADLADKLKAAPPKYEGERNTAAEAAMAVDNDGAVPMEQMNAATVEKVRTASDKIHENAHDGPSGNPPVTKLAGLLPTQNKPAADQIPGEVCEICTRDHDPDKIVLCDGCDRGYHLTCLTPPLLEVPTSQFFCDSCLLLNGADYGFEEGEDHSLYSFRRRADAFKRQWLRNHPMPESKGKQRATRDGMSAKEELAEQMLIEDHFEREFWRLVEAPNETVEVEYGADVNVTADGGGFPNLEVHPSNPYSRDGWNLNNLPILAGSLLRYIKSDISGMTIPWIYIGMVFSTFAWHKEDHYTYSINYHHWGDTKTWYGIPGEDDEKLEAAMKLAAPELFDQQPDLMFQLVTLMSPGRLKQHGVRAYACDQRPNEFVVTFPRGYHSGFNHGFNFNEAVNFALPEWLPTGLRCVNHYRGIKKNPVFSHDELLMTVSIHEKNPRSSRWLYPNWKEMVEREIAGRNNFRKLAGSTADEIFDSTEREEEEYQCGTCKTLCYLSQVLSHDKTEIACLDHYSSIPDGPRKKIFRLRYQDEELTGMLQQLKARVMKAGLSLDAPIGADPRNARKRALSNDSGAARSASPVAQKPRLQNEPVAVAVAPVPPPVAGTVSQSPVQVQASPSTLFAPLTAATSV